MKVILKRDVRGLGREGEIKDVKDGYARNFLIPQSAAAVADKAALANWERHRDKREERDRQIRAEAATTAQRLNEMRLDVAVKAGEKNRLFGSVTNREIAQLIAAQGIEIDRHQIHLAEPIKTVGEHRVGIRLMPGLDAQVVVNVVPEH